MIISPRLNPNRTITGIFEAHCCALLCQPLLRRFVSGSAPVARRAELQTFIGKQNGEPKGSPFVLLCRRVRTRCGYLLIDDAHRMRGVIIFCSCLNPVESFVFLRISLNYTPDIRRGDVGCNRKKG